MARYTFNANTPEAAEVRALEVQGQSSLHSALQASRALVTLSQKYEATKPVEGKLRVLWVSTDFVSMKENMKCNVNYNNYNRCGCDCALHHYGQWHLNFIWFLII